MPGEKVISKGEQLELPIGENNAGGNPNSVEMQTHSGDFDDREVEEIESINGEEIDDVDDDEGYF